MEADEYEPGNSSKPLHECDIDGSQKAGAKLRAGLSLGLSKHWKKALYEITGENDISAEALLEYFKPLYEFLKADNKGKNFFGSIELTLIFILLFLYSCCCCSSFGTI